MAQSRSSPVAGSEGEVVSEPSSCTGVIKLLQKVQSHSSVPQYHLTSCTIQAKNCGVVATQTYPRIDLGGDIVAPLGHFGQQQRPDGAPVVRVVHFRDGLEA